MYLILKNEHYANRQKYLLSRKVDILVEAKTKCKLQLLNDLNRCHNSSLQILSAKKNHETAHIIYNQIKKQKQ